MISNFYTKYQQVLKNRTARGSLYSKNKPVIKSEIPSFTLYIVCQEKKNTISAIPPKKKANPLKAFLKESLKYYYRSIINHKALKKDILGCNIMTRQSTFENKDSIAMQNDISRSNREILIEHYDFDVSKNITYYPKPDEPEPKNLRVISLTSW